jgi:hypothetical protein
MATYYTYEKY